MQACQVAPLKTDLAMVLRHFQRHQPTESVALPPTPAKEENVSFSVKSEAMCDESYFLRRCEAVEKRCNEVVATLNQKAYKVDVNRALENFDRRLRTAASSPPQVIPFSQDYQSDRPGEDLRQLLDASKEALEKAVEGIKSRLDALERNVGTVHSGLAKDVETLRDEIRRREQRQKSEKLSNPSPVNASTRNVSNHESTRRAIEELRRDLTALVEIKCSNSSTDRLESRLRADLEAQVKNRFCQCEPIIRRGRWLWRSGRLAHGNLIQWDLEAVNSEREAFSWQQNSPAYVKTTIAGLYRVAVGLFTRANASIHLCVDGYVVLSRESGGDRINSAVREDHS